MSPSLAPSLDEDLHLVLCDFGRAGQAYIKTDPHVGDAGTIVRALLTDQYDRPLRVVALNVEEGWSRDVSEIMAAKVRALAEDEERRSDRGDNGLHREAQRAGQTANTAAPMLSAFRDECTNAATWKDKTYPSPFAGRKVPSSKIPAS